jgi:hypothetical protein
VKLVYVSGPYSSRLAYQKQININRAWEASLDLWSIPGVYAICPHTNTMQMDGICSWSDPEEDYKKFIEADLDLLGRCDAIFMLRGWNNSKGACRERERATQLGLRVFYQDVDDSADVARWASQKEEVEPEVIQVGPVS